jgi:asparagine synthase (glutamine-hydrolysing)
MSHRHVPGVLAVTTSRGVGAPPAEIDGVLGGLGLAPLRRAGGAWLASWGHDPDPPTAQRPLLLAGPPRIDGALVDETRVAYVLRQGDLAELGRFLPPFAAVGLTPHGLRLATDRMGFRQVFRCSGSDWEAVSTSAGLLAALLRGGLDEEAVLLQSQLGWQLGQRTVYAGVTKLGPGESVLMSEGQVHVDRCVEVPARPGSIDLDEAVEQTSASLRHWMDRYLDEAEDPLLQLTGGMDSRLVLSAVPPSRRPGLRAMTLDVTGSTDARVAGLVSARSGLEHRVVTLDGLRSVTPREWFERVRATAEAHDGMLNPVAKAATDWAEERLDQGNRLGGLGGEIARGFYYTGRVRPLPVTHRRSRRLARWRMLANEAVAAEALHPRHRRSAQAVAVDAVHEALLDAGDEWFTATDDLYYRHRMSRWAGLAETVAGSRRDLANPMLDAPFIRVARDLSPRDRANARFLGRLQMRLDPALGRLVLDGRPPPETFAYPRAADRARYLSTRARLTVRKARQRASRARRPPAGGVVVAAGVVDHLRTDPAILDPLMDCGWFDEHWLADLRSGTSAPEPNTVAFLVNILVAIDAGR